MKQNYYIKLDEEGIEASDFSIYGNDCYYYVVVFDEQRNRIGCGRLDVQNMGTEASDEFIYDYDCNDDDDRETLAELLGLEEIEPDWYDEDGQLNIDRYDENCHTPGEIIDQIWKSISEADESNMLDYYVEEFAEMADEDGFVSLDEFIDSHRLMNCGFDRKCDWESVDSLIELEEFFNECGYISFEIEFHSQMELNQALFDYDPGSPYFIIEADGRGCFLGDIFISDDGMMWNKVNTPSTCSDDYGNEIHRDFDYVESEANETYSIHIEWVSGNDYIATFYNNEEEKVSYEEVVAFYKECQADAVK